MKVYKSTAGCGYGEYSYVTPVAKNKHGNDYLCLWTNVKYDDENFIGAVIENLEDFYLEEVDVDVNQFDIADTFLFKYFKANFKFDDCQNVQIENSI